jgi:hypothetical protein
VINDDNHNRQRAEKIETRLTFAIGKARIDSKRLCLQGRCDLMNGRNLARRSHQGKASSPIDFSHHDVDAAENYHHVRDGMAQAEVFKYSQVDETRRTHPIAIRVRSAITDQIEA